MGKILKSSNIYRFLLVFTIATCGVYELVGGTLASYLLGDLGKAIFIYHRSLFIFDKVRISFKIYNQEPTEYFCRNRNLVGFGGWSSVSFIFIIQVCSFQIYYLLSGF
jgi:predicted membrane-bound spermidine synthase